MRHLVLLLAAGFALSACGEAPRPASEPRVSLKLELPDDGGAVRADKIEVRGTVTPADAAVQVAGQDAEVDSGQFVATVSLSPGGNVIDVTASSPGRRAASDAVRVMRDMRIEIPELTGQEYDAAAAALSKLGLKASEERGGSWIDRLFGGPVEVCATSPSAHELVQPDSTVTLATARTC